MSFAKMGDPTRAGFKLENSPFYLIANADFKYHEDMDLALSRNGIDRSMYRVMTVLREQAPISIGRLAEVALLKRPTVSRAIERMVDRGLVATQPGAEDNRVTEVALTGEGIALMGTLTPVVARQVARAVEGIDDADLGVLIRTLQKMVSNLNRLAIE